MVFRNVGGTEFPDLFSRVGQTIVFCNLHVARTLVSAAPRLVWALPAPVKAGKEPACSRWPEIWLSSLPRGYQAIG
jgi:hypothetical protein